MNKDLDTSQKLDGDNSNNKPKTLSRQIRRENARKEARAIARRVGRNMKNVPRKERRAISFAVTKQQLKDGNRTGHEKPSEVNK